VLARSRLTASTRRPAACAGRAHRFGVRRRESTASSPSRATRSRFTPATLDQRLSDSRYLVIVRIRRIGAEPPAAVACRRAGTKTPAGGGSSARHSTWRGRAASTWAVAIRYADLEGLWPAGPGCANWGNVDAEAEATDAATSGFGTFTRSSGLRRVPTRCLGRSNRTSCRSSSAATIRSPRTTAGLARVSGSGGVLWLDAHGDVNDRTRSPPGTSTGWCSRRTRPGRRGVRERRLAAADADPSRVALVGVRSLDAGERTLLAELGVTV